MHNTGVTAFLHRGALIPYTYPAPIPKSICPVLMAPIKQSYKSYKIKKHLHSHKIEYYQFQDQEY